MPPSPPVFLSPSLHGLFVLVTAATWDVLKETSLLRAALQLQRAAAILPGLNGTGSVSELLVGMLLSCGRKASFFTCPDWTKLGCCRCGLQDGPNFCKYAVRESRNIPAYALMGPCRLPRSTMAPQWDEEESSLNSQIWLGFHFHDPYFSPGFRTQHLLAKEKRKRAS